MPHIVELTEPYVSILRIGFVTTLLGYAVLCLADLTQRFRDGTVLRQPVTSSIPDGRVWLRPIPRQ